MPETIEDLNFALRKSCSYFGSKMKLILASSKDQYERGYNSSRSRINKALLDSERNCLATKGKQFHENELLCVPCRRLLQRWDALQSHLEVFIPL